MRILALSDLHLEFGNWDQQKNFLSLLDPDGVDILILAGDICMHKQIIDSMSLICKRFENSDVIWVHGNHEYYASNKETVIAHTNEALRQNRNLHWLECSAEVIRGQRFVGTTMWFSYSDINNEIESFMNDFRVIEDFKKWVYQTNLKSTNFIEGSVNESDIVITHHLPSFKSVSSRFSKNDLNNFYVCDMEPFIRKRGPKLWIHGHTHDSKDYDIEHALVPRTTRIICNPRGYAPNDLNPDFRKDWIIEI